MRRCNNPEPIGRCICDLPADHGYWTSCRCYGYAAGVGIATTVLTNTHSEHEWWTSARMTAPEAEAGT